MRERLQASLERIYAKLKKQANDRLAKILETDDQELAKRFKEYLEKAPALRVDDDGKNKKDDKKKPEK